MLFAVDRFTYDPLLHSRLTSRVEHPFLLSDNRHFTFYIWKDLFRRFAWSRFVFVPIYFIAFRILANMLRTSLCRNILTHTPRPGAVALVAIAVWCRLHIDVGSITIVGIPILSHPVHYSSPAHCTAINIAKTGVRSLLLSRHQHSRAAFILDAPILLEK
jgi:hypothetical protein